MVTRVRFLTVAVLASLSLVLPAGAASAASGPSGTLTYTSTTFQSARFPGPDVIFTLTATVDYTGVLSGNSVIHGTLTFHPNGTADCHDIETFTGTVDGIPGTVTFTLNCSSDQDLNVHGTATVIDATGQLAGLHGLLSETAKVLDKAVGPVGTYVARITMPNS